MSRSKIAGVGVPRHEPERGAFSAPSQDEWWRWLLQRRWGDALVIGAVIAAVIREWLWSPDAATDLDQFG
jgi:hypothetical protein